MTSPFENRAAPGDQGGQTSNRYANVDIYELNDKAGRALFAGS